MSTKFVGVVVIEDGVNFRSGAGINYPKTSSAKPFGTLVLADDIVDVDEEQWAHITSVNGETVDGWMASFWNSLKLIDLVMLSPENPEDVYLEKLLGHHRDGDDEFDLRFYDSVMAYESDGNSSVFNVSPDVSLVGEPIYWELYTKVDLGDGDNDVAVAHRTPTTNDASKIQIQLMPSSTVYEFPIPKYRVHGDNQVPNYGTEAERLNLQRAWAWLPEQPVLKSNGNYKMLPLDFGSSGDAWDGCYIERKYLKEIV
ncbi:MAG: hypothetical protein KAR20_28150 [Candidatus Heimdallarchaeota archaeon]|nr:hypothetical protein [Candidatus Heimdallarchaeota archaeon]